MRIFKDIRFWLVLTFLVRLIGITNPPLEAHAWRQTVTNMAAKNFTFHNPNILYPTVDIMFYETTNTAGVSPMEFPLYNYAISLVAKVFGWADWYGRLINLILSTLGLWFFHRLITEHFSKKLADYSTYLLLFSIWFTFSRKIMPDTFSMSLAIMGLYYGLKYIYEHTKEEKHLLFFFVFSSLGILSKIPVIFLFAVFFFPLFDFTVMLSKKIVLVLTGVVGLIPVVWWYFIWCPELTVRFNNRMFFVGKGIVEGFQEIMAHFPLFLEHFTKFAFSYSGFILLLIGLFYVIKEQEKKIISVSAVLFAVFFIFVCKSGYNFVHHNYYILPFVPVLCLIAGFGLTQIEKPWVLTLLFVVYTGDSISRKQHDFRHPKRDIYRLKTAAIVDKHVPKNALITINGGPNPIDIYFAGRKGWSINSYELDVSKIENLKQRGSSHLIINKHNQDMNFDYIKLYDDEDMRIYQL